MFAGVKKKKKKRSDNNRPQGKSCGHWRGHTLPRVSLCREGRWGVFAPQHTCRALHTLEAGKHEDREVKRTVHKDMARRSRRTVDRVCATYSPSILFSRTLVSSSNSWILSVCRFWSSNFSFSISATALWSYRGEELTLSLLSQNGLFCNSEKRFSCISLFIYMVTWTTKDIKYSK